MWIFWFNWWIFLTIIFTNRFHRTLSIKPTRPSLLWWSILLSLHLKILYKFNWRFDILYYLWSYWQSSQRNYLTSCDWFSFVICDLWLLLLLLFYWLIWLWFSLIDSLSLWNLLQKVVCVKFKSYFIENLFIFLYDMTQLIRSIKIRFLWEDTILEIEKSLQRTSFKRYYFLKLLLIHIFDLW